eukprot:scaffold3077_cov162-Amphora_coffeaeformis.AAC.35
MKSWGLGLCLFSSVLPSLVSFQVSPLWHNGGGRTTIPLETKIRSPPTASSFSQVKDTEPREENDPVKDVRTTRQHWLDLRGTAIRPDEALLFFDEFLLDDDNKKKKDGNTRKKTIKDMIDCIIVPEDTFREIPKEIASRVDLLVMNEESNLLRDATGEFKGTFLAGDSTFLNPVGSLDLYNRGDWILFECNDVDSEELNVWVEQISSLLQVLPATAAPQSLETPSGLILPSISDQENSDDGFARKKGGVGICCATREAVFRVDTLLEQILSSTGSTESANSGILLLADANDITIPITSALILPFDLNLWRAVLELRVETR